MFLILTIYINLINIIILYIYIYLITFNNVNIDQFMYINKYQREEFMFIFFIN